MSLQNQCRNLTSHTAVVLSLFLLSLTSCDKAADIPGILLSDPGGDRPRVLLSSPLPGENAVELNTPIFVEFDRTMDERSVEDAFSFTGSASTSGDFQWVGNRVYFVTDDPLAPGAIYELTVRETATDESGNRLEIPYYLSFFAGSRIDAPELLSMTPAPNAQNAPPDASIELTFSRPMDRASVEEAFRMAPAIEGTFSWQDNNTRVVFLPYQPLSVGQSYSVTVTTRATDEEGIILANQFSASFQVGDDFQPPSVVEVQESGNPVPLTSGQAGISKDSSFTVVFDETMHYTNARNATSLRERDTDAAISGEYSWNADFTELTFRPSEPLEPETEYRIRISTGATDEAGNALQNTFILNLTVDDSAGAANSNYLVLQSVQKTLPAPATALSIDPADITLLSLPDPMPVGGWIATLEIEFSHDLDVATVLPENMTISKIAGSQSSSVYFDSIQFVGSGGLTNNVIHIRIAGLRENLYRLRLYGARTGILSTVAPGESSTWLAENHTIYFQVEGN